MGQHQADSAPRALTAPHTAWSVRRGDCLEVLRELAEASVDAVVCDPPYGIDFQGEAWDGQAIRRLASGREQRKLSPGAAFEVWASVWAAECARVLKPGGHLAAFGAPRTAHRLASALEDAGLELRDTLMWLYGQGMPKSRRLPGGRGTALKPAYEPIVLARKPLAGTVEENHRRHGTGTLNIDACQPGSDPGDARRWPANVLLTHHENCRDGGCVPECPVWLVDHAAEQTRTGSRLAPISRLFYCPKASRSEREAGCEHLPRRPLDLFPNAQGASPPPPQAANCHPTVKPLALMRWLIRLITPPGGLVLDPFCGSGSTGAAALLEHRRFLGIELDPDYHAIAQARITHWAAQPSSSREAEPVSSKETAHTDSEDAAEPMRLRGHQSAPTGQTAGRGTVALDPGAVEAIARRVAELLHQDQPITAMSGRLLSAAEVAEWWGVDRGWVYQHADELGAQRLGAGARPRLRFNPALVAARLVPDSTAAAHRPPERRHPKRSRRIPRHSADLLPIRPDPELSSSQPNTSRPGGAPTPPATAPKTKAPAR